MPNLRQGMMGAAGAAGGAVGYTLWGWGSNNQGQVGINSTTSVCSPVQIGTDEDWAFATANRFSSQAVKNDGTLFCWGEGGDGLVGNGASSNVSSPVQIGSLTDWVSEAVLNRQPIACSVSNQIHVKPAGTLWTWGRGGSGACGDGSTSDRSSPVQVGSLTDWKYGGFGNRGGFGIKTNGTLWSWGYTQQGKGGRGNLTAISSPVQVGSDTDWVQVSSTGGLAAGIKSTGKLYTWGQANHGGRGDGTTGDYPENTCNPGQVGSLTNWSKVSVGLNRMTALKTDGTLWSWGRAYKGAGGRGNTTAVCSPVQVGSLTNWAQISGTYHTDLAIKTDGTLWAFGANSGFIPGGQIGDGSTTDRSSPVQIGSDTTWAFVAGGGPTSIALKES